MLPKKLLCNYICHHIFAHNNLKKKVFKHAQKIYVTFFNTVATFVKCILYKFSGRRPTYL